ncbi:hypothetical protein RQP46_006226 [Phenoliferia psychrophenolica]
MPESSAQSSGELKITSFAPELIDEILEHLVATFKHDWRPRRDPKSPQRRELEKCSLISRHWRAPAQRRIFRRLVVKSASQAERVIAASGLQVYVNELQLEFSSNIPWRLDEPTSDEIKAVDGGTLDHFLALLLIPFTQIKTLRVEPTFCALSPSELHSSLASPPFTSPRVAGTPTIMGPVHLPHLKSLVISGFRFPTPFLDLDLLSPQTLEQIISLDWRDEGEPSGNSLEQLLVMVGSTLRCLSYATDSDRDVTPVLELASTVEMLSLHLYGSGGRGILKVIPPATHTLTFWELNDARDVLADLTLKSRPAALRTVVVEEFSHYYDLFEDWEEEEYARAVKEEADTIEVITSACKAAEVELIMENEPAPTSRVVDGSDDSDVSQHGGDFDIAEADSD